MVAMFAWFCADSFIQNCFRKGVYNNEYYLLFSSGSESTLSNFSLINEANSENFNTNNNYKWSQLNLQQTIDNDKTFNNNQSIKFNSVAQSYSKKYKKFGKKFNEKLPKAASEPPSEKRINIATEKRKSLHQLFPILNVKEKTSNKLTKNAAKEFRFQNFKNSSSKIDKILQFFESLNPLNGFNSKDELETYLFDQSNKIEPKDGEVIFAKPKHPIEAIRSPGVKPPKTSGGSASSATFQRSRSHNSNHRHNSSSQSSPRSPTIIGGNGSNLISSSNTFNTNNRHVSSSVTSPSFPSPKSAIFSSPSGADDFAIVDIPGQRWMGDVGRINQAFTSEYAPTSPLITSICSPKSPGFFFNNNNNNSGSFTHPNNAAPGFHRQKSQQRRRPPAPLSSTETRFAFPPPAPTLSTSNKRVIQSSVNSFSSNDSSIISNNSGLSPPFTLERPPLAHRKKPAPDPPGTFNLSRASSIKNTDRQKPPALLPDQTSSEFASVIASLSPDDSKSPTVSLVVPLSNLLIPSTTLSPSNATVTKTSILISSPSVNISSSVLSSNLTESSVTPSPPILPPRLSKSETTNNSLFVEAKAPPRPPKPTPQIPQSASTLQMNKSETNLINVFLSDQNDEKTTPEQNSPQGVELESEDASNICLAPPLPPKPIKQLVKSVGTVLDTSSF